MYFRKSLQTAQRMFIFLLSKWAVLRDFMSNLDIYLMNGVYQIYLTLYNDKDVLKLLFSQGD